MFFLIFHHSTCYFFCWLVIPPPPYKIHAIILDYFIYFIGETGEPWPSLTVVGGLSCARFGQFRLTGCLLGLTVSLLSRLMPSGPTSMWGGAGGGSSGLGVFLACLSEEVEYCSILPLWSLHADPVFWHPGPPDVPVCGSHQSDVNPTIDVSARPQVGLLPLCWE